MSESRNWRNESMNMHNLERRVSEMEVRTRQAVSGPWPIIWAVREVLNRARALHQGESVKPINPAVIALLKAYPEGSLGHGLRRQLRELASFDPPRSSQASKERRNRRPAE